MAIHVSQKNFNACRIPQGITYISHERTLLKILN